ncbi:hypothetical protein RRG08_027169 [Elysia crispata]|uniref:Uncharacterized protein n=1 Tax=Elysia crispata TaxID=231223 RepID=A0AAE1EB91_9GAST|nr:hypothetical protein RRG08_027169 [Elysia crispata]
MPLTLQQQISHVEEQSFVLPKPLEHPARDTLPRTTESPKQRETRYSLISNNATPLVGKKYQLPSFQLLKSHMNFSSLRAT